MIVFNKEFYFLYLLCLNFFFFNEYFIICLNLNYFLNKQIYKIINYLLYFQYLVGFLTSKDARLLNLFHYLTSFIDIFLFCFLSICTLKYNTSLTLCYDWLLSNLTLICLNLVIYLWLFNLRIIDNRIVLFNLWF